MALTPMIDGVQTTSYVKPPPKPAPVNTNTPTTTGSTYLSYQNNRAVTSSPTVTSAPAPTAAPTAAPTTAPPVAPPTTTTTATPPPPTTTQTSTYDDSAYRAAREAELAAALRALESQFNLSREQLLADQTEAGDQYRFIMSALQRSKEEAILGTQSGALQRGVLRSGIYLGEEAKVNQQFASQESAAAADKAAKLNAIQLAIADLEGQYSQGRAGVTASTVQAQLAAMKRLADQLALDDAINGGAAVAGGGVPVPPNALLSSQGQPLQFAF